MNNLKKGVKCKMPKTLPTFQLDDLKFSKLRAIISYGEGEYRNDVFAGRPVVGDLEEGMTDSDVALYGYGHGGVDRTCHGYVSKGEEVGDGVGEPHTHHQGGHQEGQGEYHHGGDEVHQVIQAEGQHQPEGR